MGSGESFVPDRPYRDGGIPSPQNIRAGILAYAAGDALGVPWEGKTPQEVRWEALEELPARGNWPRGSTSDDTDQLMLVSRYLVDTKGQVDERDFLTRLANKLPTMRGVGPITRAAVRRFTESGETHATEGGSIGAAMRALPFGWAIPVAAATQRRELTVRLSRVTHGAPEAIISACVVATMAAWAIEQYPVPAVIAAGLREADYLAALHAMPTGPLSPLRHAASGAWTPQGAGTPTDAVATVASVLYILREASEPAKAMKRAVALGGDTDTAAAIVGGILGCQFENIESELPWLSSVALPHADIVESTASGLYELRQEFIAIMPAARR